MLHSGLPWKRAGLALTAAAALTLVSAFVPARAQRPAGNNNAGNNNDIDVADRVTPLPPPPPQGAWGEVIMANAKWIVIQNHQGQQFPVAMDAVNQFLIRWPTTFNALTNESVIEAIGLDIGSNTIRTEHVDVFEGSDRSLVNPLYVRVLPNNRVDTAVDPGFNRFMNGFDIGAQNLLYGWAYPVPTGDLGIPLRLHVVGNVLAVNPLRLGVPGNNVANVLPPDPGVLTITQMTRGNSSFAEKGDLVYLMPTALTPRSVVLSQVVLYKKVPLRQFRLP